jgi:AraC family transcriptional regulator
VNDMSDVPLERYIDRTEFEDALGSTSRRIEQSWRHPDERLLDRADERGSVFVSRWILRGPEVTRVTHDGSSSHHTIAINLRFTSVKFVHAGRVLVDGTLVPGAIHVTAPGVKVEATYRLPCDVLHIFVTQKILAQCFEDAFDKPYSCLILLDDPNLRRDPTIERLGQLLAGAELWDKSERMIFTDSIGRAIVSRLVEHWFSVPTSSSRQASGLEKWRLRRATEYIDTHFSERIHLVDIAESAGLSRMHFASLFRLSMGVSPHEYLLRKRLEVAQGLLLDSDSNTLDIALSCGFNSQAHFISVFSRYMGDTPCRWRRNAIKK